VERLDLLEKKDFEWGGSTSFATDAQLAKGSVCEGDTLVINNASCATPAGKLLIRDLSLELPRHKNLLVVGPSGSGKSSLLRMLSELWPVLIGQVTRPSSRGALFFVPQVPYVGRGTLRDLLCYPDTTWNGADGELEELLGVVRLQHLLQLDGGLSHENTAWSQMLSPGEQQRLSIARMLLRRPQYAVLDESTSAVDGNVEADLYAAFKERGITVISVGHRPSLREYHDLLLELDERGGWRLTPIR
jgi:putative ATP-binding cassette transporter